MKKIFILFSILVTLGFFLPFIDKYSLFQIHDLIKNQSYIDIDTSKILKSVLIFIISSWFISLGYSKRVKISIIGLIGAIVYLFYYYKIFGVIFDSKDNIQKGFEYGNMLIGKENTIDIILKIISESKNHLGIGFYMILGGFISNSFALINIFKNLILLSSGNYKPKEKDNIEEKISNNLYFESIINKFKDKNFKEILVKITFIFIASIFLINSIVSPFIKVNELTGGEIGFYSGFLKGGIYYDYSHLITYTITYILICILSIFTISLLINFFNKWTIDILKKIEKYNLVILIISLILIFVLNIYLDNGIMKFVGNYGNSSRIY